MVGTTSIAMYPGYPRVAVGFLWLAGITWRQRSIPMVSSLRTSSFQCWRLVSIWCSWFPYIIHILDIYYAYIIHSFLYFSFIHGSTACALWCPLRPGANMIRRAIWWWLGPLAQIPLPKVTRLGERLAAYGSITGVQLYSMFIDVCVCKISSI